MAHPDRDDPQHVRDVALLRDIVAASGSKRGIDALARVVGGTDGPDQGDPAAPVPYLLAVVGKDTLPDPDGLVATWSGGDTDEAAGFARDHGHEVVPLYLRAPGAVAAAPPGDECPDCDGTGEDREATGGRCGTCWNGRVPPAGHEDEAAVERVAVALYAHANHGLSGQWDEPGSLAAFARDAYRDRARAALAAARGPRTPDPTADTWGAYDA